MIRARLPPRRRLAFETLEQRELLTTFAVPWPEPSELKISFAPDGTLANDVASQLFQSLQSTSTNVWQTEMLRAFQTWANEANLNVRLVADGGQPFDSLGLKQGDPRFGDIRIGAIPLAADVLAVANPYDPFVANTWVGDVLLNSQQLFGVDDSAGSSDSTTSLGSYNLLNVLLHEAGHVLGIGHSHDPASPMDANFAHAHAVLTPADIAALQAIYGARPADRYEGDAGNETQSTATSLDLANQEGRASFTRIEADLGRDDRDLYRVTLPNDVSTLAVRLEASRRSLVMARVSVWDAQGHELAHNQAAGPLNNDASLALVQLTPGATYFVHIDPATDDVFGMGGYELELATALSREPEYGSFEELPDLPPDAVRVMATTPGYVEHTYYEMYDTFTATTPAHVYRVRSADLGADQTNIMSVVVDWESDAEYEVEIRDPSGRVLTANTIFDGPEHLELQIPSVASNQDYLVEVRGLHDEPLDADDALAYEVTIDFAQDGQHLDIVLNDQLAPGELERRVPYDVTESQVLHGVISASDWNAQQVTGLRWSVLDASGTVVTTLAIDDGGSRSVDLPLAQGHYTLVFARDSIHLDAPLLFQLSVLNMSSPLGPQLRDTSRRPIERAGAAAAAQAQLEFVWAGRASQSTPPLFSGVASELDHDGTPAAILVVEERRLEVKARLTNGSQAEEAGDATMLLRRSEDSLSAGTLIPATSSVGTRIRSEAKRSSSTLSREARRADEWRSDRRPALDDRQLLPTTAGSGSGESAEHSPSVPLTQPPRADDRPQPTAGLEAADQPELVLSTKHSPHWAPWAMPFCWVGATCWLGLRRRRQTNSAGK